MLSYICRFISTKKLIESDGFRSACNSESGLVVWSLQIYWSKVEERGLQSSIHTSTQGKLLSRWKNALKSRVRCCYHLPSAYQLLTVTCHRQADHSHGILFLKPISKDDGAETPWPRAKRKREQHRSFIREKNRLYICLADTINLSSVKVQSS